MVVRIDNKSIQIDRSGSNGQFWSCVANNENNAWYWNSNNGNWNNNNRDNDNNMCVCVFRDLLIY